MEHQGQKEKEDFSGCLAGLLVWTRGSSQKHQWWEMRHQNRAESHLPCQGQATGPAEVWGQAPRPELAPDQSLRGMFCYSGAFFDKFLEFLELLWLGEWK